MIDNEIRDILRERETIYSEDYVAVERCWEKEIALLTNSIDETIDFIANRCSGGEFAWLSEVFEEVFEKTQSERFRQCLLAVAEKYPDETREYNILDFIVATKEEE